METQSLFATLTLECQNGHRFEVRWPVVGEALEVPHQEYCKICQWPGKLIKAERRDR